MLVGLYGTANVTYAGGKNSTFFNGIAPASANSPAVVNYFNSGASLLIRILVLTEKHNRSIAAVLLHRAP